jgi:hypothetical protein
MMKAIILLARLLFPVIPDWRLAPSTLTLVMNLAILKKPEYFLAIPC